MPKRLITPEVEAFILKNYNKMSRKDIGKVFGLSGSPISRYMKLNDLSVPKEISRSFASKKKTGRTIITPEQDNMIKELYLEVPVKTLAKRLGLSSETALIRRMKNLDLIIPPEIIKQRKEESRIKPGNVPKNKGMKQTEFMSAEAIERTKKTRFKKGNIPQNAYGEPGKITIRHDHKERGSKPYKYICLELGKWRPLHQEIWEKANGKVLKGYCLWFIDGDTMNCSLDNLEMISRKENRKRNHPSELLPDNNYVARCLVGKNGDPDLVKDQPNLLELKRKQLILQREIRIQTNGQTSNTK